MQYREFGKTGKYLSALGMGSTRFPNAYLNDDEGLAYCADLVVRATEMGVNYFDIAYNYAKSQCETIYKKAFKRIKTPFYTSAKTSSMTDTDADAVMRRIYTSLEKMDIDKIHFLYMWSILNLGQYQDIMRKNGPYEGALRAKEEGLIDHIIFSSHALPEETVRIMNDGAFEGCLISYSLLNFSPMQKVLDTAENRKMGLMIMNPLAGGVIPQNPKYFKENFSIKEKVSDFALKFIYSHPQVTCVLSGVSNEHELVENVLALENLENNPMDYIAHVTTELQKISNICTGCGYCVAECPKHIDIPAYLQSYNMKFMDDTQELYGRTEPELISNMQVMRRMNLDFQELPENGANPCVGCGKCEKICTQHLPIRKRLEEVVKIADKSGSTQEKHRERLDLLLNHGKYQKVAFYTAGGYTAYVLEEYKRYFGAFPWAILIVDSNEEKWGNFLGDYKILSPKQMEMENPDCILIANYNYGEEIDKQLREAYPYLNIVKLHGNDDVPWVF